jgi:hypothetical protein
MLSRYVKAQLMVLLCGGLVGPIFLAFYFFMAPAWRPYVGWMFYVGLLITAADVLIALVLTNYGAKSSAKTQMLAQRGVLALAQVTGYGETGTMINMHPVLSVNLHITGPGLTPFDRQERVIANVTKLPMITSRKLVVLVDPTDSSFQIDWGRSALVSGMAPANFQDSQDGKTYDLTGQAGPLMEILQLLKTNNIALNNMTDLRSNPAVGQQLMAIVRRAAASQPSAATQAPAAAPAGAPQLAAPSFTPPPPPQPSVAQRLQQLETLRSTGTISDAEYTVKREQIINEL